MEGFACLVLVLAPSWIVAESEKDSLRNVVEPLRAFVFVSVLVLVLWLCLRGLEEVPGEGWGDGVVVGALEVVILPCSAAHDKTDESESFLWGWR
jgi:hypothetical protein